MMIAESDPRCESADSWDGALALLLSHMHDYLASHGLDRSTIGEISCLSFVGSI